jgi:TPR repeat protein
VRLTRNRRGIEEKFVMTIKELAYSAQQHVQSSTGASFKRAHIYELLAASFGFNSHAAFGVNSVLTELRPNDRQVVPQGTLINRRCIELGYRPETATLAMSALESFLTERQIGAASISTLISRLRGESPNQDDELEHDEDELFDPADEAFGPILLDGLDAAASKGNALAHYALALIYAPDDEDDPDAGSSYWYAQGQQGRVLTGVEKEWAEAHESRLAHAEKYAHHLKEAGRLGHQDALLDLAERFDDPSFFEQPGHDVDVDPAAVAAIAERMGRPADARHWLTRAAESGDTDAMLQLIEEHDQGDIQRCWTWAYLSQLVGTDLTRDAHYAINEDGSDYDDDVGGPAYVAGRDGVDIEPLAPAQDAAARLAAQKLFEQIEQNAR